MRETPRRIMLACAAQALVFTVCARGQTSAAAASPADPAHQTSPPPPPPTEQAPSSPSSSTAAHADTIVLKGGDTLHGVIISISDKVIVFNHPVLGVVTLSRDRIDHYKVVGARPPASSGPAGATTANDAAAGQRDASQAVNAGKAEPANGAPTPPLQAPTPGQSAPTPPKAPDSAAAEHKAGPAAAATASTEPAPQTTTKPRPDVKWLYHLEAGINGQSGRNEDLNGRFVFNAARTTPEERSKFDLAYVLATTRGDLTQNRFDAGVQQDWLWPENPWLAFAQARYSSDEFASFNYRLSASGGLGYQFIKNDRTDLIGRIGLGGSRDVGGEANNKIKPEAVLRFEFTHHLTPATKISATGEYYPDVTMWSNYRAILTASVETKIDEARGISLKFGARDEFEHKPMDGRDDLLGVYGTIVFEF